jgi:hypothetical protein
VRDGTGKVAARTGGTVAAKSPPVPTGLQGLNRNR